MQNESNTQETNKTLVGQMWLKRSFSYPAEWPLVYLLIIRKLHHLMDANCLLDVFKELIDGYIKCNTEINKEADIICGSHLFKHPANIINTADNVLNY